MAARRKAAAPPPADPERYRRATDVAALAPLPARVGAVRFGTAGWTDPTLLAGEIFYPRQAKTPEARLRHYAAHFSLVEVDATYYSLLPASLSQRWVEWTPPEFRFNVKAFPLFTGHPIDILRLPSDLKQTLTAAGFERRVYPDKLPEEVRREMRQRFLDFLAPLEQSGRLGSVLVQYPPWFVANRGNARQLELLREQNPEPLFAVEFRNQSWLEPERRERVLKHLSDHRLAFVCADEPGLPFVAESTHPDLSVVRFHGRNVAGWEKKGASVQERFDYLYAPEELAPFVEPVRRLAKHTREVHAVFNNCVRNYAVLAAKDLSVLLQTPEASSSDSA